MWGTRIGGGAAEEGQDFVAAGFGFDLEGVGFDQVEERELVVGEAEEVVFFGDGFGGAAAVGAGGAGGDVDEGFVGDAVGSGVGVEVDVAVLLEGGEELLDAALVGGIGGADELVVG